MPKTGKIRLSSDLPILFTTSRTLSEDMEEGFSIGKVDYLKKPFGLCELLLRIKGLLSRNVEKDQHKTQYHIGEFTFNPSEKTLQINNERITLQKNECVVLAILCENMEQVVAKDYIVKMVWNENDLKQKEASLYNIISLLRNKFCSDKNIVITAFSKIGWKLTVTTS